jgi:hypothetical protein
MDRTIGFGCLAVCVSLLAVGTSFAAEKKASKPSSGGHVPLDSLPPAAQATVRRHTEGAVIHGISKETEKGKPAYEIETTIGGRSRDMIVGIDGALMVMENQVVLDSLEAAVRSSLWKGAGTGKITRVESVQLGDSLAYYEAQVVTAGKHSEIKVSPSGQLMTGAKKKK